jgi:photosystem II stability/assembly factor-like uncharacterized protein
MNRWFASLLLLSASSFPLLALPPQAATNANPVPTAWVPVGPDGGDARAFAADPSDSRHLYLGTTNSWLYESRDGGASWHRLAKLSLKDDLILDNIEVDESDPKTIYVAAWVVDHPDGGLFISHDSGKTWSKSPVMDGQSIRALAQAPSNSKMLVVGTLKGVFRSEDGGQHWDQISPVNSAELHEVESIAIDPKDPKTIYAGTWHLPWKTTDGGANWHNIKNGLIDDSDVFSIIIDSTTPQVVYTSACSGIYKSESGGELYHKIQGIPSTARRTRVLMQDPVDHAIVYAGTTEGLYRTTTAGTNWSRLTGPDVIINDVYVDPKNHNHVLLATDRSGVLMSNDGALTFADSNHGFSQRQVVALTQDVKDPHRLYAGVVNDKMYGGVFTSGDDGRTWQQQSQGLDGRDVFSLAESADGTLLAGTSHGIFVWQDGRWQPAGHVVQYEEKTVYVRRKGKSVKTTKTITKPAGEIDGRIHQLDLSHPTWFAATSAGVYESTDGGKLWTGGPVLGQADYHSVHSSGPVVLATYRTGIAVSQDGGKTWQPESLPGKLTSIHASTIAPGGSLWIGGREGVYYSTDNGANWTFMSKLPISDINGIEYDGDLKRVVITSWSSTWVMAVNETDKSWKWWDAGWHVRGVRSNGSRLLAASLYNGVVMQQPQSATSNTVVAKQNTGAGAGQ